jgi:hypothetical protein
VNALSPPNFLAFNNEAAYTSGVIPKTPELIVVGPSESSVSLWVSGGSMSGFPLAVVALGNDAILAVATTNTLPTWEQITVAGTGIQAIALVGDPLWLLVDDIEAQ